MITFDRIEEKDFDRLWPLFKLYNESGVPKPGTEDQIKEEFKRVCTIQVGYYAYTEDKVVGFLTASIPDSFWQKDYLMERLMYVDPEFRGLGIGKKMMWLLEEWGREHGYEGIRFGTSIFTGEDPKKARDFGLKLGYEEIGYQMIKRF